MLRNASFRSLEEWTLTIRFLIWKDAGRTRPALSQFQNQGIVEFYVVRKRRATDFETPNLRKGRSANELVEDKRTKKKYK